MKRLLVIGIDGMDPRLIDRWEGDLPNLASLTAKGSRRVLRSAFPPDSVPSWITIYTGESPVNHGVLESFNYLDKNFKQFRIDEGVFRERTFWDIASRAGKKVCVINPFLAYPPWEVNGCMVSGPVFEGGEAKIFPGDIAARHPLPPLGGIVDFPTRKTLAGFVERTESLTRQLAEFSAGLLGDLEWDLAFVCFLTLDRTQHFLWRFGDPEDPTYPGPTPYEETIKRAYRQFDTVVGDLAAASGSDTGILIVSDHGHGRRCTRVVNFNELMRRRGWLVSKARSRFDHRYLLERAKNATLQFVYDHNLEDWMFRVARFIPNRKALKKSAHIVSWGENLAQASYFAGTNPFGGIEVNRERLKSEGVDYEDFRDTLIREILALEDPDTGKRITRWARRREDVHKGKRLDVYPDVLFEMEEDYGVNWALHTDLVTNNPTHRKISGGHAMEGVFLLSGVDADLQDRQPAVQDIAPTVLDLLGVEFESDVDGRSLLVGTRNQSGAD
ncbi:MAG: alkaline phosphatase family protein [Candidatus Eisenbacteria sp.]|nr:alkaline phosphatase family protein [Candidatus Eisenbacteria bacterium]